ncbi:MAG: hypothetical protein ABSH44_18945 [Bryobacteraceae bacterium]|jgi:hypothetical protein
MALKVAAICALSTTSVLLAQQSIDGPKTFQFGATAEETYKFQGAPTKWYVPEAGRYLKSIEEFKAAVGVWSEIRDVYMRETPTNLYEIQVQWRSDNRASRLHPILRVHKLEVLVDKPTSVPATLKDIAESKDICKSGCDLYGLIDELEVYPFVLAFPAKPTAEQLKQGADLATDYKPEQAENQWCVALKLKLERGKLGDTKPPNWSNGKVIEFEIGVFTLSYELRPRGPKSIEIGVWMP